jgi:hypothetical protein
MKVILIIALIVSGYPEAFLTAQNVPTRGTVEGAVINSATGAGIGGAYVELSVNRFATGYHTTTDAAGHFRITGMAQGSYLIGARKDGFGPSTSDGSVFLNSELNVALGGDPARAELKLTPLGTMFGRVLGPDGKPAAGVEVSVYQILMAEAPVTDEEGRFEFKNMSPGSYTLVARPPRGARPEQASDGTRTAMVTTYYPSVADLAASQQIAFRGESDLGDYEIRMQTAPVHRVRGIVLDEERKPSPQAELKLFRIPDGPSRPTALRSRAAGSTLFALGMRPGHSDAETTVVSGKDGDFEFPAVPMGNWMIEAAEEPARGAQRNGHFSSRGAVDVLVGGGDVDDLKIHLMMPFKLMHSTEWKELGNQRVRSPRPTMSAVILVHAETNEVVDLDLGAGLYVLPGRYKAVDKPGLSSQVFLGESEVTRQIFLLSAAGPRLRIVTKTRTGTVRGTVKQGDGATVVLIPQRVEGVALGQTVVCGPGGSFELSEVTPGDYYIAAFDRLESRSPPAPMLLGLMPSKGTNVKVEEGSTESVTLSIISAPQ